MNDQTFQEAFGRVRARHTEDEWLGLGPREITDKIYREIRRIDAERLRARELGIDNADGE